jgi:uncharacterized protein (DUF433 family)
MTDEQLLERITLNPRVMAGKAVIKGTRLTVDHIFNLLAHGMSTAEIIEEYPGLTEDDIHGCFLFAARSLGDTAFMPLDVEK